jgi:hypothetical protein
MCLTTPRFFAKRRVAKQDITVWKFMLQNEYSKQLYAYYRLGFEYHVGKSYEADLDKPVKSDGFFQNGYVNKGLHSLSSYRDALHASRKDNQSSIVIVRCTIPKGSEYYVGDWEGYKGYASSALIVDEVMPYEIIAPNKRAHTGGSKWAI